MQKFSKSDFKETHFLVLLLGSQLKTFFHKHLHPLQLPHLREAKCKKTLGKGTFGIVKLYECTEHHDTNHTHPCGKCFVVKKCCSNNKKCIDELNHEYRIATNLKHENIARVLDYAEREQCIIIEHFEGIDMFTLLTTVDILSLDFVLDCFHQLLLAVDYLHRNSIAHMDIKLENLIVNEQARKLKLIDFGEATHFGETIKTNFGTMAYRPPETIAPCHIVIPSKCDIWACGLVLYELVYYKIPWSSAEISDKTYSKHCNSIKLNKLHPYIFPFDTLSDTRSDTLCKKKVRDLLNNLFYLSLHPNWQKRSSADILLEFFTPLNI